MIGRGFVERQDWLQYVMSMPEPRVAVLEDIDGNPGNGAFWDEAHARVHLRLGCVGAVTNGALRDVEKMRPTGFHPYAGRISAEGYAHIIDMGQPVEGGGLDVQPGDLIHGDIHGILVVPTEVLAELPRLAARVSSLRKQIAELCAAPDMPLETVMELLKELTE